MGATSASRGGEDDPVSTSLRVIARATIKRMAIPGRPTRPRGFGPPAGARFTNASGATLTRT